MKRIAFILILIPAMAFAGRKVPVTVDETTGLVYPRTKKTHVLDLPAGTTLGGSPIGGGGGSGTVVSIASAAGTTGLAASITNPTTAAVITITGTLNWANLSKTGSALSDLASRPFSALTNKPTTLSGYGITNGQSTNGVMALAGFSSITGRVGNSNLPLGAQIYDSSNHLAFDFENRVGKTGSGESVFALDDVDTSDKFRAGADLGVPLDPTGTTPMGGTHSYPISVNAENFVMVRDINGRLMLSGEDSVCVLAATNFYLYSSGTDVDNVAILRFGGSTDRNIFFPDESATVVVTANSTGVADIAHGGTNATSASAAVTNLGAAPVHLTENAQTGTTYTLVLADDYKLVTMTNASANTLTVPTNASVTFPVGTRIYVEMHGAGTTTFAAAGGVTINSRGGLLSIAGQYGVATLVKKATNTWLLSGDLQ